VEIRYGIVYNSVQMKKNYPCVEELDAVLERLGGNEELFLRLLTKFRETYGDTRPRLEALLTGSKYEDAHCLVHSVKGVAANLGIMQLYRYAIELETRMKAGSFDSLAAEKAQFLDELDSVIACLGSDA